MFDMMDFSQNISDHLAGKTILITGASGFIGSHLCRKLLSYGAKVHALSRKPRLQYDNRLQWWTADCTDGVVVRHIAEAVQPHLVFHLASHVTGSRSIQEVLPTFHDNLASTVHLLSAVADCKCYRVVLAGSSEVPQTFDGEIFACSPYAAAKWASCLYGRTFHRLFHVPTVMPRIFMTYGPGQVDTRKLVPMVTLQLLRGQIPELSSGKRRADWIYVDDVVESLVRAAVVPGIEGSSFDLGTGLLLSVRQVVEYILAVIEAKITPAFGALQDRAFEQEESANTDFLRERLGYEPRVAIKEGIEATVAWYRQQLAMTDEKAEGNSMCFVGNVMRS